MDRCSFLDVYCWYVAVCSIMHRLLCSIFREIYIIAISFSALQRYAEDMFFTPVLRFR
jgi:hypothetical protein